MAGACISSIFVLEEVPDNVAVIAASAEDTILDASGNQRLSWYRFQVPVENEVVRMFLGGKKASESGEYRNPQFTTPVVIEGTVWGTDPNPDDLGSPITVLRGAKLMHIVDAMDEIGSFQYAPTDGMQKLKTKVAIQSQVRNGHVHEAGSEAIFVDTTSRDGKTLLIEVQADGWQECLECSSNDVEKVD